MGNSLVKLYFLFFTMKPDTGTLVQVLVPSFKNSPFLLTFDCFHFAWQFCMPISSEKRGFYLRFKSQLEKVTFLLQWFYSKAEVVFITFHKSKNYFYKA